jgi:hypothetical protein
VGNYLLEECFIKVWAMEASDRRTMERFDLKLPIELFLTEQDKEQESIKLMTSNVCAGGTYLIAKNPLPKGTPVKMNITLEFHKHHELRPRLSIVDVSGYVIRTDHQGMAICFDRKYRILSQDAL